MSFQTNQERIDALTLQIHVGDEIAGRGGLVYAESCNLACACVGHSNTVVSDLWYPLRLQNPNVVGSGFIQHPPQRPFERPMLMQPGTIQVGN